MQPPSEATKITRATVSMLNGFRFVNLLSLRVSQMRQGFVGSTDSGMTIRRRAEEAEVRPCAHFTTHFRERRGFGRDKSIEIVDYPIAHGDTLSRDGSGLQQALVRVDEKVMHADAVPKEREENVPLRVVSYYDLVPKMNILSGKTGKKRGVAHLGIPHRCILGHVRQLATNVSFHDVLSPRRTLYRRHNARAYPFHLAGQ